MGDITADSLRKIKISIGTILILIPFLLYGIDKVNIISDNSKDIFKVDSRVVILEAQGLSNHDALLELRFNLKKFMEANGEKYIELNGGK